MNRDSSHFQPPSTRHHGSMTQSYSSLPDPGVLYCYTWSLTIVGMAG